MRGRGTLPTYNKRTTSIMWWVCPWIYYRRILLRGMTVITSSNWISRAATTDLRNGEFFGVIIYRTCNLPTRELSRGWFGWHGHESVKTNAAITPSYLLLWLLLLLLFIITAIVNWIIITSRPTEIRTWVHVHWNETINILQGVSR